MKKLFVVLLSLCFINFSLLSFEGISKKSYTKDGYAIRVYQIDRSEHPKSYEFYVQLTSNNSEEYFTWCFDNLADTMEHFKWLETVEVVKIEQQRENAEAYALFVLLGQMTLEQAQKAAQKEEIVTTKYDKRELWREYSKEAEPEGTYIRYWISKTERVNNYGTQESWR